MHEHLHALAIHAYYVGEHAVGRRASERLLNLPIPEPLERQARANRTWYTQRLADLVPQTTFRRIEIDPRHEGWSLFNPTLAATPAGVLGIVRSSNYRIEGGRYVIPAADGDRIRTENVLLDIGDDLAVSNPRPLVLPDYATSGYSVEGWEDCRLRQTQSGLAVSATVRDALGWDGRCRIATAALDPSTGVLSRMRVLEWDGLAQHEKNWMPIAGHDGWLYGVGHEGHTVTVIAEPDMPGVYEVQRRGAAPHLARGFRGGGQLVPCRDGWLAIVHEVAPTDSGRVYEHRFLWFDGGFALRRWSPLFAFRETRAIEFAAGLAVVNDAVFVSFGVRDAEAWIASLPEDDVCDLLAPVS